VAFWESVYQSVPGDRGLLHDQDSLRVIYDPMTTKLSADGKTYTRTPFAGNKIPSSRWDSLATKIVGGLWNPNNAGDDRTGLNNFKYNQENIFHYYNFSGRVDWQISQNWKAFARVSRFKTDQDTTDFTDGHDPLKLRNVQGSKRNGWNIAADTVYNFSPKTSINVRGAFYKVEDKRDYPAMNIGDYSNFWPDGWWKPYMEGRPLVYAPYMVVDTTARGLFGVQPRPACCVTATLHLPLPHSDVRDADLVAARRQSRDLRFNPQRHLRALPEELVCRRAELVQRSAELCERQPREHGPRRLVFGEIRRVSEEMLRTDPWRPAEYDQRIETLLTKQRQDRVALDREYFYALHPRETLDELVRAVRRGLAGE
jgi:hypothetical protein